MIQVQEGQARDLHKRAGDCARQGVISEAQEGQARELRDGARDRTSQAIRPEAQESQVCQLCNRTWKHAYEAHFLEGKLGNVAIRAPYTRKISPPITLIIAARARIQPGVATVGPFGPICRVENILPDGTV